MSCITIPISPHFERSRAGELDSTFGATQINFQMPYETSPGLASVEAATSIAASAGFAFMVAPAAPGIFTIGSSHAIGPKPEWVAQ